MVPMVRQINSLLLHFNVDLFAELQRHNFVHLDVKGLRRSLHDIPCFAPLA